MNFHLKIFTYTIDKYILNILKYMRGGSLVEYRI